MKKIILLFGLLLISCKTQKPSITKNNIDVFHLNKELPKIEIKDDDFDITVSNQIVTSIITRSNLYKTKHGFRVGSNMSDIEKRSKTIRNELKIAKGYITIGHLGQMIIFNGVAFIDENNNNLVDYIWIKKG